MRLITRSDFDGLACAVLLQASGLVTDYIFAHPKDIQDGKIHATANDILANVPYVPGGGMWFDHHSSEKERAGQTDFKGSLKLSQSCARLVWDYFGGHAKFSPSLDPMLDAVDRFSSGNLSLDEINDPQGWILLGVLMDPRTGLGRHRGYRISNYQLMRSMVTYCGSMTAEEVLREPDVQERVTRYFSQQADFCSMIERCARVDGNVLLLDFRDEAEIFAGNRYTAYGLYPQCNVRVQVIWGLKRQNVVISVGRSIVNRSCSKDIGQLMLDCGGGGHRHTGACQVPEAAAEHTLAVIIKALKEN